MSRFLKIFASLLLAFALVFAPASASFAANAQQVEFLLAGVLGSDGTALDSGLVYTYSAGTTTNKTTWTDAAKTTAAANPVVLDSYGKATIYADGNYKFLIKTAAGVTVVTLDNLYFGINPEAKTITSVSTDYTVLTTDFAVLVNATGGAITITLPAAASYEGREFVIVKTDASANAVTVDANGAETINGSLTYALSSQYDALRIISDASNWMIPFVVSGVSTATTTTSGISELATDAEALAETATNRVLTPSNLAQYTFGYRKLGLIRGLVPAYKDADEITWSGGVVEVNGTVYALTASADVDMDARFGGAFANDTWYYVYIDPPASGYTLAAADFEVSATAPSYDSAKQGFYHGVNTDWRCIGVLKTNGAAAIEAFYVSGGWWYFATVSDGSFLDGAGAAAKTAIAVGAPSLGRLMVNTHWYAADAGELALDNGDSALDFVTDKYALVIRENDNAFAIDALLMTDTSQQVYYRQQNVAGSVTGCLRGFALPHSFAGRN